MDTGIIDIIIAVIDRPTETKQTLEELFEANTNIRIILVDDGSTELTNLEGLPSDKLVIITTKGRLGQAKSVNIGLDFSTSEYVIVMHNDIVIKDKEWVQKAITFLKANPEAGLITDLGWQLTDGDRLPYIPISSTKEDGHCYSQLPMLEDFVEVYNTDNIVSIFKNDGIRADERYGLGSYSLWIDFKAKGLKLYVMKFNDSEHLPTSSRDLKAYTDLTTWDKERKIMNDIAIKRMIEYNITMPKPEIKEEK